MTSQQDTEQPDSISEKAHKKLKTAYELALASEPTEDGKKAIDRFYHTFLNNYPGFFYEFEQALTSWKDKEVEKAKKQSMLNTLAQLKTARVKHCLETPADEWLRETEFIDKFMSESLQSQGGKKLSKKEFVDLANEVKEIVDKEGASDV